MGGVPSAVKAFKIETPARAIIDETRPVMRWQEVADAAEQPAEHVLQRGPAGVPGEEVLAAVVG